MTTGAVILGAGFSRRFGSDKRLHCLHGQSVAECTVEKYVTAFDAVRVVIREDDHALRQKLARFAVEIVVADNAHLGMGHSLAAGFTGLTWDWAFVALLDMPFIATTTLIKLEQQAQHSTQPGILRPRLRHGRADMPAHPIGWHKTYFDELRNASGDVGAKAILQAHSCDIIDIYVDDEGIVKDIDQPGDLD